MIYCIIENGVVTNRTHADAPMGENWIANESAQIGWRLDGETFSPPAPPIVTLDEARADVIAAANAAAERKRDAVVAGISPAEMASWALKRAEAITFSGSGNPADAPMLGIEAAARGISLAALVTLVLRNAQQLSALEAMIAGRCGALVDAARAAQSVEDVQAIDVDSGWPV